MVAVAGLPYPVTVAAGALDQLESIVRSVTPANRVVVITDKNVGERYGKRVGRIMANAQVIAIEPASNTERVTRGPTSPTCC